MIWEMLGDKLKGKPGLCVGGALRVRLRNLDFYLVGDEKLLRSTSNIKSNANLPLLSKI